MLSSRSLTVFLNRATKPLHLRSTHGSLPSETRVRERGGSANDFWNLHQQQQQQQQSPQCQPSYRSLDALNVSLLYNSPNFKKDYYVIVANCGGCNCYAFVIKLLESAGTNVKTDHQANMISFRINSILKHITFIEVDFQKHDLWTTLSFEGCILLYSPSSLSSYKCALQKLSQLKNRREKCMLWVIGVGPDPAVSSAPARIISYEQAEAEVSKNGGRYWEVIPDGKTVRSPLVYNQIVTELVSLIADSQIDAPAPDKITFEFTAHSQAIRKMSRSCEYVCFT